MGVEHRCAVRKTDIVRVINPPPLERGVGGANQALQAVHTGLEPSASWSGVQARRARRRIVHLAKACRGLRRLQRRVRRMLPNQRRRNIIALLAAGRFLLLV
jgi:hypothetical protein